jgi:thymidylate kinase
MDRHAPLDQPPVARPAAALVVALADELARSGVRYCHWKSNAAIERSETGENDLDLLIMREDGAAFFAAAARLGFVAARGPSAREVPSFHDLYAVDPSTKSVIHLHAHFQMIVGDDTTKNYRLPIEHEYIRSSAVDRLLPVPTVEFEYVVFVVRMTVKYAAFDARLSRRHRMSAAEERELAFLRARAASDRVAALVSSHLPQVGPALFAECERVIDRPDAVRRRAAAAWRLQRALRTHARRPFVADTLVKLARRAHWLAYGRRHKVRYKKRPVSGGALIAVVGGDGSGKSTLVRGLTDSLSAKFVVSRVHLGKPPMGRLTRAVRRVVGLGRRIGLFRQVYAGAHVTAAEPARFPGHAWLVLHTLIARDRRRAYGKAARAVTRGELVVSDRFPLATLRSADGSRTAALETHRWSRLARWLANHEQRAYQAIRPADLIFVLRVDPDTAVTRRPQQDVDFVTRRNAEIWSHDWDGLPVNVLDASQPISAVLDEALGAIWKML